VTGALRLMERAPGGLSGLQVLHVTGERYGAEAARRGVQVRSPGYRAVPYLHGTYADALAAADLVISRAGASAVAELTACGLPMVLIPWSRASRGEQVLNAEPLARAGAAVVIRDEELTEERLAAALGEVLRDRERREAMARQSRALGRPEAAETVAALLLELAEAGECG
jgi:UDP-N-acetylglucosamine:LPS N-acetylglucosamine transferase